jgi:hypothetical protein
MTQAAGRMTTKETPMPSAVAQPSDDLPAPVDPVPLGVGSPIYLELVEERGDPVG